MKALLEMIGLAKAAYYEYKQRAISKQEEARKVRENRIMVLLYENNEI